MHSCAARQEGNYTLTQSSDSHSWSSVHKKHTGTVPSWTQAVRPHTKHCPFVKKNILFSLLNCNILGERSVFRLETFPIGECFVWMDSLCSWRNSTGILLVCWRSRMGITWLRQCVIPFLMSSTRMHPTIPIHTMLSPEDCTASWSCDANLSRERFVPFGRTFGAPYSQLDTR